MSATYVAIDKIETRPQVRTVWDEAKLQELAASIKEFGVLEPLIVRSKSGKDSGYVLEMGRRRLEASKIAGLTKVPVLVTKEPVSNTPILQLIENLQREDMNDMDLAEAFKGVMDEQGLNVEQLAAKLSKTKGFIKQRLSLIKVAPSVQEAVRRRDIDFSAARVLCSLPIEEQEAVLEESIAEETAARKVIHERRAKMADLPGVKRAKVYDPMDESEEEEEEEEVVEKIRKPRSSKTKPDPKAKTSTVKRVTRRKKREKTAGSVAAKPTAERLDERTKEWLAAFIDDDTSGKGLDESSTPQQVRNLLKRYTAFLLERRALVLR